jgi:quinol monooxygenase YgiN
MNKIDVRLRIRPEKRDEFLQTIRSIQSSLKKEETDLTKSCLYKDMDDTQVFHLTEEWATQDAMELYIRSERFSILMGALKVLCLESEVKYQMSSNKLGRKVGEV